MALIAPFRGLRYNLKKIGSLGRVVTPPYDVIDESQQDRFYLAHEHNIIRLILGKNHPGDNGLDNRYIRAAKTYKRWWIKEILTRDVEPAIYLYEIRYPLNGHSTRITRKGFISLLKLSDYQEGQVRPHERTFSATKEERLSLIDHAQANFSQIFTLYDDPRNRVVSILEDAAQNVPPIEFRTEDGVEHCLRLVTDPEAHSDAARIFAEKTVYIADGHHRYETCLAYRNRMRMRYPTAPFESAFNYTTIYATSFQDPGLKILPAHRLVKDLPGMDRETFTEKLSQYFEIQEFPLDPDPDTTQRKFKAALMANGHDKNILGYADSRGRTLRVLTLREGVMSGVALQACLKGLDVIVLSDIIYGRSLDLSLDDLDNEKRFLYDADLDSALDRILAGEVEMGFLLNPTRIEQLQDVSNQGLVMPRKSTYFYPKVHTGLVVNPLIPSELIREPRIDIE